MKIRELLNSPEKWCQDAYARTPEGISVSAINPRATSFCLMGAAIACYPEEQARTRVITKIQRITGLSVGIWNDSEDRKWKEIRDLINGLDI